MADEQQDWYAVLGVERTATSREINKAYRTRALKVHPDKNPDPNAAKVFHELTQAVDLLLDPAARAAFDNLLNAKVQAKARTDKYDSTRKRMKEELESREKAFRTQQQDEKTAAQRLHYEIERLKKEGIKKRAEREADLLRQADEISEAVIAARVVERNEEARSLDSTLKVKWKKKKHTFEVDKVSEIFGKFGQVDSCLSKNQGSALVSFKTVTGAYAAMKAQERNEESLEPFSITWAGGVEPIMLASLRSKENLPADSQEPTSTPSSSVEVPTKAAFNVAFATPAFGSGSSFGSFPLEIPSFGPPPVFNLSKDVSLPDDYEAATLARMRSKNNERKRLAEEMLRLDREEEERLASSSGSSGKDEKKPRN